MQRHSRSRPVEERALDSGVKWRPGERRGKFATPRISVAGAAVDRDGEWSVAGEAFVAAGFLRAGDGVLRIHVRWLDGAGRRRRRFERAMIHVLGGLSLGARDLLARYPERRAVELVGDRVTNAKLREFLIDRAGFRTSGPRDSRVTLTLVRNEGRADAIRPPVVGSRDGNPR